VVAYLLSTVSPGRQRPLLVVVSSGPWAPNLMKIPPKVKVVVNQDEWLRGDRCNQIIGPKLDITNLINLINLIAQVARACYRPMSEHLVLFGTLME
jgi:hypothetical protein